MNLLLQALACLILDGAIIAASLDNNDHWRF